MDDEVGQSKHNQLRLRAEEFLRLSRRDIDDLAAQDVQSLVHELQVYQVELEMQNEELRGVQIDLQLSRDQYQDLFEFAPVGYLLVDRKGTISSANLTATTLLGVERSRLLGARISDFIAPEDQDILYLHLGEVFATDRKRSCQLPINRGEEGPRFLRMETVRVPSAAGQHQLCKLVLSDVSESVRLHQRLEGVRDDLELRVEKRTQELSWAADELSARQARLSAILDTAGDAILSINEECLIESANAAAERMFGHSAAELTGMNLKELLPPPYPDGSTVFPCQWFGRSRDPRNGNRLEFTARRQDGVPLPVEVSTGEEWYDHTRKTTIVVRDVSERKRAEQDLSASEARLMRAQERAHLGSYESNLASQGGSHWSPELFRITGLDVREEAPGPHAFVERFVHENDRERARAALEQLVSAGEPIDLECRLIRVDGEVRDIHHIAHPTLDPLGDVASFSGTIHDITGRKQLEREFRHAQKMEAVGRLAGEVAHDFNNVLMAISATARLVEGKLEKGSEVQSLLREIGPQVKRANQLTRRLLDFSRRGDFEPRSIDLCTTVSMVRVMCERILGEEIKLLIRCPAETIPIFADPAAIEQSLFNLLINAKDAMPGGGEVRIEVSESCYDAETARRFPNAEPGRYCILSVIDTGVGMDAETRSLMFEPFFTTKEVGKGTGLGLSSVYGCVLQFGGHVSVETEPGKGTTIRLCFPRHEADELATPLRRLDQIPRSRRGAGATILLAEHDDSVRLPLRDQLEDLGHHVLDAAGAEQALRLFEQHHADIDLLLTEVALPEMDGSALFERIEFRRPGIKVVYMSDHSKATLLRTERIPLGCEALEKPFTEQRLSGTIRAMLGAPPTAEESAAT